MVKTSHNTGSWENIITILTHNLNFLPQPLIFLASQSVSDLPRIGQTRSQEHERPKISKSNTKNRNTNIYNYLTPSLALSFLTVISGSVSGSDLLKRLKWQCSGYLSKLPSCRNGNL